MVSGECIGAGAFVDGERGLQSAVPNTAVPNTAVVQGGRIRVRPACRRRVSAGI